MGGRYLASLDWHCCWWHVSSELLQAVEREEGRLKHSGRQEVSQDSATLWYLNFRCASMGGPEHQPRGVGAVKAVAHHGILALLSCLLSPPLPKALVVLLSHSGAAGLEQRAGSVLHAEGKSVKTFWWKYTKSSRSQKCPCHGSADALGAPAVSLSACLSSHELPRTRFNSSLTTVSTCICDG